MRQVKHRLEKTQKDLDALQADFEVRVEAVKKPLQTQIYTQAAQIEQQTQSIARLQKLVRK